MRYRHLRRTTIALLATIALLLVLVAVLFRILNAPGVRAGAARWLATRLAAVTGARIRVESLEWQFVPPRVALEGISVRSETVSLTADEVTVTLSGFRLARRTLELGTVAVRGVHLAVSGSGLERRGPRQRPWITVHVRHLALDDVTVEGTDLPGGLGIFLDGVRAGWTRDGVQARGFAAVRCATLALPRARPVTGTIRARFAVDDTVRIRRFEFDGELASLTGTAELGSGRATATARGTVDMDRLDTTLHMKGLLEGRCAVELRYRSDASEFLDATVRSRRLRAAGFSLEDLAGRLRLSREGLKGELKESSIFGGRLTGSYELSPLGAPFHHTVRASGRGFDLDRLLAGLHVPPTGAAARADAEVSLEWNGTRIRKGHGEAAVSLTPRDGTLPASGDIQLTLTPDGLLRFDGPDLLVGHSRLSWEGPLTLGTWEPAWSISASSADLHEVVLLVNSLVGRPVLPDALSGTASLHLSLGGPWRDLRAELRMEAEPLGFSVMEFDRAVIEGTVAHAGFTIHRAAFLLGSGSGEVTGRLFWGNVPDDRQVDLTMSGTQIPLARLVSWLGKEGVGGNLSFAGQLRGALAGPRGSWALGLVDVSVGPLLLGDGSASADLSAGTLGIHGLQLDAGASGEASWNIPTGLVEGSFTWKDLATAPLGSTARNLLGPAVSGEGRFRLDPDGGFTGDLETASATTSLRASVSEQAMEGELSLGGAARATLSLERRDDGAFAGDGHVEISSLATLLERLLPVHGNVLDGTGNVKVSVVWPEGQPPRVTGVAERLDLKIGELAARLVEPATFSLDEDGFVLRGLWLRATNGNELFVRLSRDAAGALNGNISGKGDARLLRLVAPQWETAGEIQGVISISGTMEAPGLDGIAELTGCSFRIPESSIVLSSITGTALLSPDGIVLDGVSYRLMGGGGTVAGRIRLVGTEPDFDLSGTLKRALFPLFPGLDPRLSGTWWLRGRGEHLTLGGDLVVNRTLIRRNEELSTILLDWFGKTKTAPGAEIPRLDLRVEADHTIEARNAFLRLQVAVSLHITGTPGSPGLVGRVSIAEGGEFTFQGTRYELDHALITFSDPTSIVPHVDIRARAQVDIYEIWITLVGTGDRIVPTFSSDPPLSQEEIVSLIATGAPVSGSGGSAPASGMASSVLSSTLNQVLEMRARSLLAIDQVRVDPFARTDAGDPTARVTLVKQISPSWTVAVESNLSTNREELIYSRWILAPQVYLEATRRRDGSWSLDLRVRKRY